MTQPNIGDIVPDEPPPGSIVQSVRDSDYTYISHGRGRWFLVDGMGVDYAWDGDGPREGVTEWGPVKLLRWGA